MVVYRLASIFELAIFRAESLRIGWEAHALLRQVYLALKTAPLFQGRPPKTPVGDYERH